MNAKEITGKGWAFPVQFDPEGGTTVMAEDVDDINQSLYILFTTEIGERVMQPEFGSALKRMLFESINEHFITYMRLVLTKSITVFEARIQPLSIEFYQDENEPGKYIMHLEYMVLSTRRKNNFLFPFYLG